MQDIPPEVLMSHMLPQLSPQDIIRLCKIDKRFNEMCKNDGVWKSLLERDFPEYLAAFQKAGIGKPKGVTDNKHFYFYLEQFSRTKLEFAKTEAGERKATKYAIEWTKRPMTVEIDNYMLLLSIQSIHFTIASLFHILKAKRIQDISEGAIETYVKRGLREGDIIFRNFI